MKPQYLKDYHPNLLSWNEFENIINIRPLMTQEKVHILSPEAHLVWENDVWTTNPGCYPPTVLREAIQKYVCWFSEMSRTTETINNLAYKIEKEFKSAVDAHIYSCIDIDQKHPFGIHFDDNDNIIVQCEGKTHWKIWDKVDPNQYNQNMEMDTEPIIDSIMEPGDAVQIPAHYPHLATSTTSRLSVSFPMPEPTANWGGIYQEREWVRL